MADYNHVTLIGRLTRDPELRFTPSGVAVCDFGLAVNRKWKDGEGNAKEEILFIDVTAWKKVGESTAEYLKKGSPAMVVGYLSLNQWTNQAGEKRSKLKVTANQVIFLGGRGGGQQDTEAAGENPPAPAPESPTGTDGVEQPLF